MTRFIEKLGDVIEGKLIERQHTLQTERQRQNKEKNRDRHVNEDNCDDYENDWIFASEGWDRKKGGTYFTQEKFRILSIKNEDKNKKIKNEQKNLIMKEKILQLNRKMMRMELISI